MKKFLVAGVVLLVILAGAGWKWMQWTREQAAALALKEDRTLESMEVFVSQRRFETARTGLRGCMKLDLAGSRRLHLKEGRLQMSCGMYTEALQTLQDWAKPLPDDVGPWAEVARCQWLLDRQDACERQLLDLQKVTPGMTGLSLHLAEVHARQAVAATDARVRTTLLDKALAESAHDSLYERAIRASIYLDRLKLDEALRELDPAHIQTFVVRGGPHSLQEVDAFAQFQGVLAAAFFAKGDVASATKALDAVRVAASAEFEAARAQVRALGTPATRIEPFLQLTADSDTPVVTGFVGLQTTLLTMAASRDPLSGALPDPSVVDFVVNAAVALSDDRATLPPSQLALYRALQTTLQDLKQADAARLQTDITAVTTALTALGPTSPVVDLVMRRTLPATLQVLAGDALMRAHATEAARTFYQQAEKEPLLGALAHARLQGLAH